jgi:hypothetical protein
VEISYFDVVSLAQPQGRGAQPTEDGFKYLAQIGVKTVIDLRTQSGEQTAQAL